MKLWKKCLIASAIWIALMIAGGIVHVKVIRAGQLDHEQRDAIGARYVNSGAIGLVLIWIIAYARKPPEPTHSHGRKAHKR